MKSKRVIIFSIGACLYLAGIQYLFNLEGVSRILVALLGYVLAVIFAYKLQLTNKDVGLPRKLLPRTIVWSMLIIVGVFTLTAIAYSIAPDLFKDSRYDQTVNSLLRALFLYLPFSVVVFEEVIFRGIILGYLLKIASRKTAIIVSSLLFGLWHIPSAQDFSFTSSIPQIVGVVGIVLFTALSGWVFSELRIRSSSLLAPIALHWSVNGAGMLFAYLAWRIS
jgi:membrane protease YdiL (CAAX protease family)